MRISVPNLLMLLVFVALSSCKNEVKSDKRITQKSQNSILYASGLSIVSYDGYDVVTVSDAWPQAKKDFTYVLKENQAQIPDSLSEYETINVPLKSIVVTSTTSIPFLEMLGVEKKLIGFPHTDYVSSVKTRRLIDAGKVTNIGQNEKLNIEQLIALSPDAIVTFGIDNSNPVLDNLQKSGLKVLIQADWMEQTPLGKAEWIKLYGALFGKKKEANTLFNTIVKNYKEAQQMVATKKPSSTVLYGSMYADTWYVAKGNSWVAQFMKDAKANYLWSDVAGSGSLNLPFEKVLEKAQNADYWIATGAIKSKTEFEKSNPHYAQFTALQKNKVFTFEAKLGAKGGTIYYETAASRPDLVLKDYIKIFHPEVLPNYNFTFAEQLQ
ncbi:ABC transporter substrate-binding protein [Flavobacterium sp. K77]|uniref:ABC transporter substrate-binding protein n=1 Tax=Flavobacterium sp. K77 TaxID=2910676 RepID=UPI001F27A710|nr:ABC transporter substrate-binding protein [Flavobacterium sp. K77]MCF6140588.1 ABC transporter substrate-binding protein [Flavobacterium sp. K77]